MRKNVITLFIIAILGLFVLTGCATNNVNDLDDTNAIDNVEETTDVNPQVDDTTDSIVDDLSNESDYIEIGEMI